MELKNFKIVKNRVRPDFCYAYEKYSDDKSEKYSIFTMDGGNTFLASVTSKNNLGKLVDTEFSDKFNSPQEGLDGIINFKINEKINEKR